MSRVIIVEDDTELRDSLVDYLSSCGHVVVGAASAIELYQLIANGNFDVALVDVNLPHYDGLTVARYLSEKTDLAIIVMTVRGSLDDRVAGYNSGADLYLVKPVDPEELAAAIHSISSRRKRERKAEDAATEQWKLRRKQFTLLAPCDVLIFLTRREMQFLEALAARPNEIVPRVKILAALGYDVADPENRALDAAISRLRTKVQAESATTLPVQTVQGSGYVFSGKINVE